MYYNRPYVQLLQQLKIFPLLYYLTESGAAAKGWVELDGKWYYFDRNNGDMKRGTTIDGYTVNEDGVYVK